MPRIFPVRKIESWSQSDLHLLVLGLLLLTALVDYATGYIASLSAFYLIPLGLLAWYGRSLWCYPVAALTACLEQWVNELAGKPELYLFSTLWNELIDLVHFVALVWLLRKVRFLLKRERELSRIDVLTGLPNRLMLLERLEGELARCHRERTGMAVGFIDLDHFKAVNDRHGHSEGDRLLKMIGQEMRTTLRRGDLLARLGGDEFAFIAVHCTEPQARAVADKLLATIADLSRSQGWPVSGSIGLLHLDNLSRVPTSETVLDLADGLMYDAKTSGRAAVRCESWRRLAPGQGNHERRFDSYELERPIPLVCGQAAGLDHG